MGKIQMTEYQARELFSDIGLGETVDMAIDESKKNGYIRKTALEEAEERYEQSKRDFPTPRGVRDLADEYIQELKSEIARGKK